MVLKKPYGFLIKHFRLIHLILAFIYIYLAFRVNSILTYYKKFAAGTVGKLDALKYADSWYIVAIVFSIIICFVVYILMRYKKKPKLFYVVLTGIYLVVWIMMHIACQGLNVIYISVLETKTLRLYRDLMSIMILFQYITIFFVLFRGLGFDIKKFNFDSDLVDLGFSAEDEEEIEVVLGGTQSLDRKIHRRLREFKYYCLENKAFLLLIGFIILIFIVFNFYFDHEVVNKVYNQGESFSTDKYSFRVVDTYVTTKDYDNKVISNSFSFVVVKLVIGSNYGSSKLNTSNLSLNIGNNAYTSSNRYSKSFKDLGVTYRNTSIKNSKTYLFIYQVNNDDLGKNMFLDYAGDKKVKLKPTYLDELYEKGNMNIGDVIDLSNTVFGYGNFRILSCDIQKEFSIPYEYEIRGETRIGNRTLTGNGLLMQLKIESVFKDDYDNYSFLHSFSVLKYKKNDGDEVVVPFSNRTPVTYQEGIFLDVDSDIQNATNIWFEFMIRNQKYIYQLK